MNVLQLLLSDEINIAKPSKLHKVKRLSNEEHDFTLTLVTITLNDIKKLRDLYNKNGEFDEIGFLLAVVCYGVQEFDNRIDENKEALKELCKLHKVKSNTELVNKIFLPNEIKDIASEIMELSGNEEEKIEEVKGL